MKHVLPLFVIVLLCSACDDLLPPSADPASTATIVTFDALDFQYPRSLRDSTVVDDFFGRKVADPYRWLEGDTTQAVSRWVDAQQGATEAYLTQIPYRSSIAKRLGQLWDFARFGIPEYHGEYYYLFHNDGQQNQDALYRVRTLKDDLELVLDPNTWSADGTRALGRYQFSPAGDFLAYQVSEGGSDWQQIRVLDLKTGQHLDERLRGVKFSNIAWAGRGFYYSRYPGDDNDLSRSNTFHQLYYHRLGTPQSEDQLVYADRAHPQRNVYAQTDSAGHWLVLSATESTSGNALYFRDLRDADPSFVPVVDNFDHDYVFVGKNGSSLLFLTNDEADNWRLIQVSTQQPERGYWEEIIPQRSEVLQEVKQVGDRLLAKYLRNATSHVVIFDLEGKEIKQVRLPELGTLTGFRRGKDTQEVFFGFTSFTRPETVYRLRLDDYRTALFRQPETAFRADDYQTKQVWVKSADGTEVPVFLIARKGVTLNTPRPTLLYGYGGFDISIVPKWNLTRLLLVPGVLENGGVVAVANLRGGG
ncbi:MAG: S9 family peptidase, partial [Bacteroidota bacterium]